MGKLVDGVWTDQWYDTSKTKGEFMRSDSAFREWIGSDRFPAESGRYHLYVSYACPWAHRALIFRKLKGLESHISVSVVSPLMLDEGWTFEAYAGSDNDPILSASRLHEIYTKADPKFTGRVTVPVLWDKEEGTIVNNESSEIIRMMNSAWGDLADNAWDGYPQSLQNQIDSINEWVYRDINNGVYKTGFATTQEAYEKNYTALFEALDKVEGILERQLFLCGESLTEADWRLFTTLYRFDPVYVGHFKCNRNRIADYPEMSDYLRCLYQQPGIGETCNLDHIKAHYYSSHKNLNPTGIVPRGPLLDMDSESKRKRELDLNKELARS